MEITDKSEIAFVMCFRKLIKTKKAYIELKKKRSSNYDEIASIEEKCDDIYFDLTDMIDSVKDGMYAE